MRSLLFVSILFVNISATNAQALSQICTEIAACNRFDCETVGFSSSKSEQHKRMVKLSNIASIEQLDSIAINTDNEVLRLSALLSLKNNSIDHADSIG